MAGDTTPLTIAKNNRITRPTVYDALKNLKERQLVKSHIDSGRKYWSMAPERVIEEALYVAKKQLLGMADNVEEIHGLSDASIVLHRGSEAIKKLLLSMVKQHASQRLYILSGNDIVSGWEQYVGEEVINEFNRAVKKHGIITEMIISEQFITEQLGHFGPTWGEDFEGRTSVAHEINPKYLETTGQIFVFQKSVYLIAMNEAVVVEVRNSEIQKMILSLIQFIQDHAKKFDINQKIRTLLEKKSNQTLAEKTEKTDTSDNNDEPETNRFTNTVLVHRGESQVRELLFDILSNNKKQTLHVMQGDIAPIGWDKIFDDAQTIEINELIKQNQISVEAILPFGWLSEQYKLYGTKWAESFAGRSAPTTSEIDVAYFNHGGQFFLFKDSIYLMSLNEALVIEIRNSAVQTLLFSMFQFIQDQAYHFDINEKISELMKQG